MASIFEDTGRIRSFREAAASFLTGTGAATLIFSAAAVAGIYQIASRLGVDWWLSLIVAVAAVIVLGRLAASDFVHGARRHFLLNLSWKPLMTTMGAAALMLTLASFMTTWLGLSEFTGDRWLSFLITTGVQVLMLALALLIGNIAASESAHAGDPPAPPAKDGRRARPAGQGVEKATVGALAMVAGFALVVALFQFKVFGGLALIGVLAMAILIGVILAARRHVIVALSFMLAMCISSFFSFDALYSTISPEEKRSREALILARSEVQDIFGTFSERFTEERKRLQDSLIKSDTWIDFSKQLEAVQKAASESDSVIEDSEIERQAKKDAELNKLRDDYESSQKSIPALEADKEKFDARIKALQDERAPLAGKVEELRAAYESVKSEADAIKIELKSETDDGQGKREKGCGTECKKITERLKPIDSQAKREKGKFDIQEKRLKEVDGEISSLNKRLGAIGPELDRRKHEAARAASRVQHAEGATAETQSSARVDQTGLASFNVALKIFTEKPTREGFQDLVATCDSILTTMRDLQQLKDKTTALDCDPKGFSSDITLFVARTSAMDDFNTECTRDTVSEIAKTPSASTPQEALARLPTLEERQLAAENQTRLRNKAFGGLLDIGNKCLSYAYKASPGSTAAQRDRMDSLALSIDPEAHRFQRNLAVLDRGDKTAFLAAIIALAMDGLVFVSGLYWARTSIPPITRRGAPSPGEMKNIIDVNLDVDPEIYGREPPGVLNAKIFLHYLRRDFGGLRDGTRNAGGKFSGVVNLREVSSRHRAYVDKVLDVGEFCEPIDGARDCFLVQRRLVDYLNEQIWKWQAVNPGMKPKSRNASEEDDAPIFDEEPAGASRWPARHGNGAPEAAWMFKGLANDDALDDYFGLAPAAPKPAQDGAAAAAAPKNGGWPRGSPGGQPPSWVEQAHNDPALERTADRNRNRGGEGWRFFRKG